MNKNFEDFEVFIGNTEAHREITQKYREPLSPMDSFTISLELVKLYHEWLNGKHDY